MLPRTLIGCSSKNYFSVSQARAWGPAVIAGTTGSPTEASMDATTDTTGRAADSTAGPDLDGLFICPSFPLIPILLESFGAAGGLVGAQDVSIYPNGAYTGEVSATVLAELGARFVMVGHPERRNYFGETPEIGRQKVKATTDAGIAPILVVGEAERGQDARAFISAQLDSWLADFPFDSDLIVAYEPAWAIGQPKPAPADHVAETITVVRELLADRVADPRVLYGGSAQAGTFAAIAEAAGSDLRGRPDGVFMGRFGLDPADFLTVVREVRAVTSTEVV